MTKAPFVKHNTFGFERQSFPKATWVTSQPGLQIQFDWIVADRYVNQCAVLKPRDELIVLHRVDGDAAVAPSEHAVISGAEAGCSVPVRVEDTLTGRRLIVVAVIGGAALKPHNNNVSINGPVIAVHNRLVVLHHL